MKTLINISIFLIICFTYAFYLSQKDFQILTTRFKPTQIVEFYDYKGAANVRTNLSNGSSSPLEVINEAKKADLDFLIITDLNQNEHYDNYDGYYGNLLVTAQGEYRFMDMRLLHFSSNRDLPPKDTSSQRLYFTDLLSQKSSEKREASVVLAHPFLSGPTWTGTFPMGVDAMEIVNPKRISQDSWINGKINVLWSLVCYPFNPTYAFLRLFREPLEELSAWDNALQDRKLVGLSGVDASARAIPFASYLMKFPSYQKSFEITSNHILLESELTGNYQKDRQKIFEALKRGQLYFSLDIIGDPKGFTSYLMVNNKKFPVGSEVKNTKGTSLIVQLPAHPRFRYEVAVYKNGEVERVYAETEISHPITSPGIYRVVVRANIPLPLPDANKWVSWIYTNPYFIK